MNVESFPHKASKVVRSTDRWGKNAHCEVVASASFSYIWQGHYCILSLDCDEAAM